MNKSLMTGLLLGSLAIVGCATGGAGGSGEVSAVHPTFFSKPTEISDAEFKKDPKSYAKSWTESVGGGMDDFKKITIPAYTIDFQTFVQKAEQNRLSSMINAEDGAKNILDLKIAFPWEDHKEMLQEIVNTSYIRLKDKMKKAGLEVVEWSVVKAKSTDAQEFEKDKMNFEAVKVGNDSVSIAAPGLGRLDSIFWSGGASSLARSNDVMVVFPKFAVGFGYFDGEKTPYTLQEGHGNTSLSFTPEVQVYSGSGIMMASKYESSRITLGKTAIVKKNVARSMDKAGDSRAAANAKAENVKVNYANIKNTDQNNVKVSTRAGVGYVLNIDPVQYKQALLAELDHVEDLIVQRYKTEID